LPASLKSHASAHAAPSSGLRMSGPCLNAAGGMASPGSTHDSGQKDASYSQTPASPLGPQRLAGSAQPSHHSHVACRLFARSFHAAHRRQRGVHQLRERHFLAQLMHTCSSRRHASATVRRADPQRARGCALDIAFISAVQHSRCPAAGQAGTDRVFAKRAALGASSGAAPPGPRDSPPRTRRRSLEHSRRFG